MAYFDNKNNNQRPVRPQNVEFNVPLYTGGVTTNGRNYNIDSMLDIVNFLVDSNIPSMIQIPVTMPKSIVNADPEKRGFVTVGYVKVIGTDTIKVSIFPTFADKLKAFQDYAVVAPRVLIAKDNNVYQIISLDIVDGTTLVVESD